MTGHEPAAALLERLDGEQISYEVIEHRRTETAAAEAEALGIDAEEVAKTLVLKTPEGFVRTVLPASERLDLRAAKRVLETKDVHLASEEALAEEYPEFELGAVPPVGGSHEDRVLVDRRLIGHDSVVIEAGTHDRSLRLKMSDLVALAKAEVADLCRE
jgi:Ala-tRNA(Pro) deacylase